LAFENASGETVTLQWETLWDAAEEAGYSRLYGGIHIQDGDLFGRQIGADVAKDVWEATRLLFDMDANNVFEASTGDVLYLGAGSDEIIGGLSDLNGLQVFDFGADDAISINSLVLADDGFKVSPGSAILELDQDGDGEPDAVITLEGEYDDDRFIAVEVDGETTLRIATDADVELTDSSERFITTDPTANVVAAGDGDDVLVSSGGGDILDGDDGNDVLLGGAGEDILIGAGGTDIATGGAGSDIFSFDIGDAPASSGVTAEFITDFESGIDKIELSGFGELSFDTFNWLSTEAGVALELPNSRFIVFEEIDDQSQLAEIDFVFPMSGRDVIFADSKPQILTESSDRYVSTGPAADDVEGRGGDDAIVTASGADLLIGGDGSDALFAGSGDDTLEGGAGSNRLEGGTGSDLFRFQGATSSDDGNIVADFITDYEAGTDRIEIFGFNGISAFSDVGFSARDGVVIADLGTNRFIVFEGISDVDLIDEGDFSFTGEAPVLSVSLQEDSGSSDLDLVTFNPTISGSAIDDIGISKLELSVTDADDFQNVTSYLQPNGDFSLDQAALELVLGAPLGSGAQAYTLRATDLEGQVSEQSILFTLDQTAPTVVLGHSLLADFLFWIAMAIPFQLHPLTRFRRIVLGLILRQPLLMAATRLMSRRRLVIWRATLLLAHPRSTLPWTH